MLGEWGDDAYCLFSVYPTRIVAPREHNLVAGVWDIAMV